MGRMDMIERIDTLEKAVKSGLEPRKHFQALGALAQAYSLVGETNMMMSVTGRIIDEGGTYLRDLKREDERKEMLGILEGAYVLRARWDLHSYLMALEWHREPEKKFYVPRMRIMKPVVDAWTDMFVNDKYDLMLFSMPPGVAKSTLGIFAATWVGWRDPERCNLMSGYADRLAKGFYKEINSIYADPDYSTEKIFPRLELVEQSAKEYTIDFTDIGRTASKRFPTFTCRSIDGSLTGATRCENLLYCDDLVEGIEEAMSPGRLDTLWQKYTNDLASRKKDKCKEVHIGTRWSTKDPIGRLEDMYGYSKRTCILRLPALDENDESNFDYPYNLGFSTEYFRTQREKLDSVSWGSLYQQQPVEREGLLFLEENLKTFTGFDDDFLENNPPDDIFAFVDVAFGGNDYLSMPIAVQWGEEVYIVDWVFMKGDYKTTQPIVKAKLCQWRVKRVIFEANNGGDFYARDIEEMLKRDKSAPKVLVSSKRAQSTMGKMARIQQHSPVIMDMTFLHPDYYPSDNMYRAAIKNVTTLTQTGKNQNDDAPDSLAGLATMIRTGGTVSIAALTSRPRCL